MIKLGAWSATLLVFASQCLLIAGTLALAKGNRQANRMLALLLVAVAGLLAPFILGYAGAYDAWPWLTFAPFAVPLAIGPLLYAHVRALADGGRLSWWHWVAPALQFGWQAIAFLLPLEAKPRFDSAIVEPFIGPLSDAAVLASMVGYGVASWTVLRRYRRWLDIRRRSSRPARRIRAMILILLPLVAARAGYSLFEALVRPTDYFDLFGYYLLLGASAVVLGLVGWRQAEEAVPAAVDEEAEWRARGERWIEQLKVGQWWRNADFDLDEMARRLATNRAHLSQALSGHGGFATVVGVIRAEAVAAEIDGGRVDNLLQTALDCGFGSKASFNRAFRARFGVSPSQYRGSSKGAAPIQAI
jgi:AraC-like DNA-binding protein